MDVAQVLVKINNLDRDGIRQGLAFACITQVPGEHDDAPALVILHPIALVVDKDDFVLADNRLDLHAAYRDEGAVGFAVIERKPATIEQVGSNIYLFTGDFFWSEKSLPNNLHGSTR